MTGDEAVRALRALRLLRRGTLEPAGAPGALRPLLAGGLGPACEQFAAWLRRSAADPRAAQAAVRFFGLDRLPEGLGQIGATLAPRSGGRGGVGARQAERLVSRAVAGLASGSGVLRPGPGATAALPPWRDPFPLPQEPVARRWLAQVVVWAWAQVPAGDRAAAAALLCYEHEHALRARGPVPSSRTERQRWRRLAWSVLQVASHRAARAARIRGPAQAAGRPGGGLLAVTGTGGQASGLAALTAVCADPRALAEPDLASAALAFVRAAVRHGRHEATELLALLRDGASRHQAAAGPVLPVLECGLITLSAIVARERRDPAGVPAARAGLRRIDQLLDSSAARDHATWFALVESGYRTSQELADLHVSLGKPTQARVAVAVMRARVRRFGDPDPSYLPEGWQWNLLVTEASVYRHLARASPFRQPCLRAAALAGQRAAELAAAMALPASWAVAAENEIIATGLDRLADPGYRAGPPGRRLLAEVTRRLQHVEHRRGQADDQHNRDTRRALLHASLLAWQLALQQADPAAIRAARTQVKAELHRQSPAGPILPAEAEHIARYEQATRQRLGPRRQPARRP